MKHLSTQEIRQIVHRDLPGFRVSEVRRGDRFRAAVDSTSARQMQSPGLAAIQEKLRDSIPDYSSSESMVVTDEAGDDVIESVVVEPKASTRSNESKTVLISTSTRSVVGSQG